MAAKEERYHILVVEDRGELRVTLRDLFEIQGYGVTVAPEGRLALEILYNSPNEELMIPVFDLMLLDLGLPDMNGIEVLRDMREHGIDVPVIIFTAYGEKETLLQGFDLGAADFVTKPVHADELLARVEAILRRTQPPSQTPMKVQCIGDIEINFTTHEVTRAGTPVAWSAAEFEILRRLLEGRGSFVARERLQQSIEHVKDAGDLERHLRRIRETIQPEPVETIYLESHDEHGFRLTDDVFCESEV